MRAKVSKNIHQFVSNEEVLTSEELKSDITPEKLNNLKRRKKIFWNNLNWKQRTKRTKQLRKGEN